MTYAGVERVVLQGRKTSGKCLCQNAVTLLVQESRCRIIRLRAERYNDKKGPLSAVLMATMWGSVCKE
jgi:hypothetical protein